MGIDQAGQDELARGVDDRIIRGLWPNRARGIADMDDPVSLDNNQRIRDRIPPGSVNQCPFLISSRGEEFVITAPPYTIATKVRA